MLTGSTPISSLGHGCVSLHGMSRDAWQRYGKGGSWFYEVEAPGFKYNMTDIQAALGLVQLRRLDQFQVAPPPGGRGVRGRVRRSTPRSRSPSSVPRWSTPGTCTCCGCGPRRYGSIGPSSSKS